MTQKNELLEALKEMLTACELGIPLSGRGLEKARAAIAAAEQSAVSEPMAWNKSIRDRVDVLLAQAGYMPDSSVRNALSCMNFDTPPAAPLPWQTIESAPKDGNLVVVYSPNGPDDWPDALKVTFDYFCQDYGNWFYHSEAHEHYVAVGGSNACGPDVSCTGPSEKAPYTHWMPLPPPPNIGAKE